MSSDKINNLFWLYYGQAIKDKAGANYGSTGAFFLATEAQKGPPAGDGIPDSYTYQGLYDFGNNLLAADNVFYNPSALHGYDQAIGTYLNWVDMGGQPDPALDTALLNALKSQDGAQIKYNTEKNKAAIQYKSDLEIGVTNDKSFALYIANGNCPGFVAARTQLKNAGTTIEQIQKRISGPMGAQISDDRARLAKGLDGSADYPGFNMPCAMGNLMSPAELLNAYNAGTAIPDPTFQRLPAYNAPNYKKAVQAAQAKVGNDYHPDNSVSFTIDTGKETSDFNFGQKSGGVNVGVSYGWFSFNANAEHSSSSETLDTSSESDQVSVTITYDNMELVTITPGSWNIDVSKYKLRSDAPKDVQVLARPTQFMVATRMGYKITVGSKTASTLDTKLKSTTSAGGNVSIFGIPISVGGSGSSSSEKNTHVGTWDNASKTFTVEPSNDTGFATIVAVVGEKFTIL